ncbi:AAA-ATPase At3g50940-like [Lolium perenne]|uniref:AAA-ATPase At3g50940-like n=1 Tax=Lolium perenne TaxID=4522 RepID=UPI0021EB02B9|nr:AAA-ATPase At3g50940-like [Lolium perenne]
MAPMDPSPSSGSTVAYGGKAADAYRKALSTAASAAAYAVLARSMARELLPDELRAAARWGASVFRARLGWAGAKERRTLVVRSQTGGGSGSEENLLFDAARTYLSSRLDPRDMRRLGLTLCKSRDDTGRRSWRKRLFMEPDDSTIDVFDGVQFTWTSVEKSNGGGGEKKKTNDGESGTGGEREFMLMLSFDAEHTELAMERYVPFVMTAAEETELRERSLKICLNEGRSWFGLNHHHPATFDTLAMDPTLKQSIVADLDLFANRRDHYRRIGKAWKRGYLLYGPPGTGKSSLVAAMANHLRYNIYDLDLSHVESTMLRWLLPNMHDRSILVIEDIDCCCDAMSRAVDGKGSKTPAGTGEDNSNDSSESLALPPLPKRNTEVTLSALLNFIDGLWSTSCEERIIVFTTNYKDRLDPALLRPGRMDMHIYMGFCCWEAFKTLARNYFVVDDHPLCPEIQDLLAVVQVTPAEVSEMLLRTSDADVALQGLTDFLKDKKQGQTKKA